MSGCRTGDESGIMRGKSASLGVGDGAAATAAGSPSPAVVASANLPCWPVVYSSDGHCVLAAKDGIRYGPLIMHPATDPSKRGDAGAWKGLFTQSRTMMVC